MRARAYLLTRQLEKALSDVRESLWRMDPVGPNKSLLGRDYFRRAQCYAWLGAHEKAEVDIQTALEYYSDSKDSPAAVYNILARLYATGPKDFRSPQKALPLALKAVQLSKTNHNILNTLGVVYYRLGQLTNAIETLEAAIKADSSEGSAHDCFFLAMSYHRLGNPVRAEGYYAKAMKWMEDTPESNQTWDETGTLSLSPEWKEELEAFRAEAEETLGRQK